MSPDFAEFFILLFKMKRHQIRIYNKRPDLPHFITTTVVDWVDVFSRKKIIGIM